MKSYNYEKCPQGLLLTMNKNNPLYLFLFRYISDLRMIKNRIKILEIGTGGGKNLQAIYIRFGNKVELFGTDFSNTAINYAKSLKIGKFYLASSDNIPIAEKFDLILMIDILEHLETEGSIQQTLNNAQLYLNDGAYIYISVPIELNKFSLTWFFSKFPSLNKLTKVYYGHLIQFNRKSFLSLIDPKKFKLKEVFYSFHFLSQLHSLFSFFLPKILLQFFLGEELAINLRDSNVIINGKEHSLLNLLRRIFMSLNYPLAYLAFKESNLRRNSSFAAGNMHLLISKK